MSVHTYASLEYQIIILFTEVEVNRPGYSPSRECDVAEYPVLSLTMR